jgi:3-oxoacyl-[acyl-carrier protein] reductase
MPAAFWAAEIKPCEDRRQEDIMTFAPDRVAVVTGGAQSIGRAIVDRLAKAGVNIVIADIQLEKAQASAKEVAAATGRKAIALPADVSSTKAAAEMMEKALAEMGRVDILVNNAGTTRDNLIMRMDEADWDKVLDINLKGAWNCSKAVIRAMMKARYGRIVNMASVSGLAGQAGQTNYSASKAGLVGFTKALAREVASRGITVNAVAPGFVPTALTQDLPAELKEYMMKMIPVGRWGTTEEIAYAVEFLAADEAAYITGHVLSVDGGMVMM